MRRRWVVASVVVLGGLAWLGLRRPHRAAPEGGRSRPVAMSGRVARNVELARLGSRAGGGYAAHRARRAFASAERRDELDAAFELKTAEQVAAALGQMKGAMMKLGQMASYLDAGLPEHVRDALAQLQQDAPPMSAELAAGVIERELGAPPITVFAEWDEVPIASASIGQVHRAITHEGNAVAVKVQYPGVDEAIRADLANVDLVFGGMGLLFPGMDPGPIVEELRARALEELDYENEARNQRYFADHYIDHPFIHVPDVLDRYSTARVLTTELAEGVRFDEMLTWSHDERNLAAEAIYRFAFGSIYQLNVFNGDPHPGNYLFQPGGRVTFLDYGLVKHFEDEVPIFVEMIDAMVVHHDIERFRRAVEDAGVLRPGMPFGDQAVEDYFSHFYDFVMEDEVTTISDEYASESVRRFFDPNGPYGEIMKAANLPPGFVIVQRINLGLYAIFAQMGATANWRRMAEEFWPNVAGPPSTEMGERHAAWAARAGRDRDRTATLS
jgi:predicted unusual protein kinase regulating ubiquinone biosynthesis (AarF/ABC1/UbiB family)